MRQHFDTYQLKDCRFKIGKDGKESITDENHL